jgi:hypothetical protein
MIQINEMNENCTRVRDGNVSIEINQIKVYGGGEKFSLLINDRGDEWEYGSSFDSFVEAQNKAIEIIDERS